MWEKIIEAEADSLEKARKEVNIQICSKGFYIISEEIITKNPKVKIAVKVKQKQQVDYESLSRPVFQWSSKNFIGDNQAWTEKINKEHESAIAWFKAQSSLNLDNLSAEIIAEYFVMWSRQALRDDNFMDAWAGWHQVLRFASLINDEYKIAEACLELGKIYKDRGEIYEGGKYWEIAQLFFLHLAYLLRNLGEKKITVKHFGPLGEICLLLNNEPLCKQLWLEAMVIFQTVSPTEVHKIEKALQMHL